MTKYNPPKWKYHAVQDAVLVKDEVEESKLGSGWSDSYIEKKYPKHKYRPSKDKEGKDSFEMKVVASKEADDRLGKDWHDSPAHFGFETTPGLEMDQDIAVKKSVLSSEKKPESKKPEVKKGLEA